MKKQPYFLLALAILFLSTTWSCKKTKPDNLAAESSTPLYALIIGDTSLSIYNAAVQKSNNKPLFLNTRFITVLIPTNAAFLAAGISLNTVNAMSVAGADSLVRYHYIDSVPKLDTIVYTAYKTLLGPTIYGLGNTDTINAYFNGRVAIKQKLAGSNASVFEINVPLQTPASSIAQVLAADSTLSYFAQAVKDAAVNLVPGSGWNTILAPDNNAFIAAGYPTLGSIDSSNTATLTNLVQYHVIPGQYFSNFFTKLSSVTASQGGTINISIDSSSSIVHFIGTSNTDSIIIKRADKLVGSNVIVQKMSGVLKP